jgi:hypothetical protein
MINWDICKKVLVALAVRKIGRTHSERTAKAYDECSVWYEEQFETDKDVWYLCCICGEKIVSYPVDRYVIARPLMISAAEKHGIQHLKESNLLPFL